MPENVQIDFTSEYSQFRKAADEVIGKIKALEKEEEKHAAFSAEMTRRTQAYMAVQKQKAQALEAATKATQKQRISLTELKSGLDLAGQGLRALQTGYNETVGVTMKYAATVRDLAIAQGQGAKQASLTLQVLDDFEIGAEDITTAMRAMKEKGLVPTVDTLADLADQFVATKDPAERLKLAQDNLGRSSAKFLNVLSQGGDVLRKNATQVNKSLILTDEQIKKTEAYRLALDNLNDSITGLKVSQGTSLIGDLTQGIWQLEHAGDILKEIWNLAQQGEAGRVLGLLELQDLQVMAEAHVRMRELTAETDRAAIVAREYKTTVSEQTAELEENEEALKALSKEHEGFINTLGSVGSAMDEYKQGVEEANAALEAGDLSVDEHKAKLDELAAGYEEAKNDIILSIVQMKMATDGWTNAEINAYLKVGQQLGKFTDETIRETQAILIEADRLTQGLGSMADNTYHAGERAEDAAANFGQLKGAASELGQTVAKTAVPPVAQLKRDLSGMPKSGTSWSYLFDIQVSGRVPNLPGRQQAPTDQRPGQITPHQNMWTGGQLDSNALTVVGDAPGGRLTPYSEVIYKGHVFDAETTRKMSESGMLDGARSLAGGTGVGRGGTIGTVVGGTGTLPKARKRTATAITTKGTIGAMYSDSSSGSMATDPATATDVSNASQAAEIAASVAADMTSAAVDVSSQAVAQTASIESNLQIQTAQITASQSQTADALAAELQEVQRLLRRQPTRDDMYALWHSGQQQSI
jgi:hypothetical protein